MATYYVDNVTGSDGNSGTGTTEAWVTIQQAANTVAAGDTVYVKGGSGYSEAVEFTTVGSSSNVITFEGYTTTPGDGGLAELDGGSSLSSGIYNATLSYCNWIIRNFEVHDYTDTGISIPQSDNVCIENCIVYGNGSAGIQSDNDTSLIRCKIYNNGGRGAQIDNDGIVIFCEVYNNSSHGLYLQPKTIVYGCEVYGNVNDNVFFNNAGTVISSTIDGDGKTSTNGINLNNNLGLVSINNIIYDCGTGINGYSETISLNYGENNILYNNTTDYSNWPSRCQASDITSAPSFTDEANGDYTLASDSPARNAGADVSGTGSTGMDIGAYQSIDAGTRKIIIG